MGSQFEHEGFVDHALLKEGSINDHKNGVKNGVKHDQGKPMMGLLPFDSLEIVSQVLSYGAKKYAPDNWKKVPDAVSRYEDAMLRHISAYKKGEMLDSESGLPHLAHACCCLMFLISFTSGDLSKCLAPTDVKGLS